MISSYSNAFFHTIIRNIFSFLQVIMEAPNPLFLRTESSDWFNPNQLNCHMHQFPSCQLHMQATVRKPVIWDNYFDISDITAINVFLIRDFTVLFIYSCQMCVFYPMLLHFGCLLTPWYNLCWKFTRVNITSGSIEISR